MQTNHTATFRRSPLGFSLNQLTTLAVFVAIFALFSVFANHFFSVRNVLNLLVQTSTFAILSIAATLELIVGGIDFSLGAIVAFGGSAMGMYARLGLPLWLAMMLAVCTGGLIGAANGFLIAKLRMPPFIATFAMAMLLRGSQSFVFGFILSHFARGGRPRPSGIGELAAASVFPIYATAADGTRTEIFPGLSWLFIIMLLVALFFHLVLTRSRYGRYLFLVGSNEAASRLSGINTTLIKISAYVIAGMLASLTGILLASRMGGAVGGAAGYEMTGIICAMIGGASLFGGAGSVVGSVIGAFILSTLSMGLTMMNPDRAYLWPNYINGMIVLAAIYLDQRWNRKHAERRL